MVSAESVRSRLNTMASSLLVRSAQTSTAQSPEGTPAMSGSGDAVQLGVDWITVGGVADVVAARTR